MSNFEEIRKLYPGLKRGLETEFSNFKKHKDWQNVIDLLKPAIENEMNHKQGLISQGSFCPAWKMLQTWINQRCWEQEYPNFNNQQIIMMKR